MTTTQATGQSAGSHPFTTALAARDVDALMGTVAPDPVLYSAVSGPPFRGREMLRDLYASVFDTFDELRITDELHDGRTHVLFWEGSIGGRFVAGADRLRTDAGGMVEEITIVGRPMTGLSMFITGIGFHLARRRRGIVVARALQVAARPLAPMFALIDRLAGWALRR